MSTDLPVPMKFQLPDGWHAASPDELGLPDVAFVALNAATHGSGFTANITIDGEVRTDGASLAEIADESVANLRDAAPTVTVAQRTDLGGAEAPGLAQDLRVTLGEGEVRDLVQSQVYLTVPDAEDSGKRAVVRASLTVAENQLDVVLEDFREFVSSIRLDTERL
ncbi:hypothetical protein [Actinophytocola sp.]|uniref:hypothetical protein n=1 Tax=Actinophytocola sp. TaxID=1872138 RepID=UPI003D6A413C